MHKLVLHGLSALSQFRLDKLAAQYAPISFDEVIATYRYYILLKEELKPSDVFKLEVLLEAEEEADQFEWEGELSERIVIPRLGTISPWCSKATDIAHHAGFEGVLRIERAVVFTFADSVKITRSKSDWQKVNACLFDRMTEDLAFNNEEALRLFAPQAKGALETVPFMREGRAALDSANKVLGLALSDDELAYLAKEYAHLQRDPTDAELMMFAQANSEHCRHKIFNAEWTIDGVKQERTLFDMIRHTHQQTPQGTEVAYSDNAAVLTGGEAEWLYANAEGEYQFHPLIAHSVAKVETHNHPTAIAAFAGASTGAGGEIRDEGATGRGSKPKAGLSGFTTSHLRLPGMTQPWEKPASRPGHMLSPLAIMTDGPLGAAAFNNEFGRPNLLGYFRTFEHGEYAYHKPIMIAGGVGSIAAEQTHKELLEDGMLLIQLGGPGMRIGLGGGAASSIDAGAQDQKLDFDSVQRGNPEMERRAQEVIDRCWQMGADNPIVSIHDVGAGGLSNALPELVHGGGVGGRFALSAIPSDEPSMSPRELWCNESQERYVLAIPASREEAFKAICARERCPYAVLGVATRAQDLLLASQPMHTVDMPLSVLLGKMPRMHRIAETVTAQPTTFEASRLDWREALYRVLQFPAVADKRFLIHIGDRSVGGLCVRDQLVGPWQIAVADCAVTARDLLGYAGEVMSMGEKSPLAVLNPAAAGRMAVSEALLNMAAARVDQLEDVKLSANWMAAAGKPGQEAALFATVKAVGMEFCPALGVSIPVGKDSLSM
ncbi:MAG: hypothetical protein RLZZ502_110, partial [Pseudomonadota bacterium]